MRPAFLLGSALLTGAALGLGSAWWVIERGAGLADANGPWTYNPRAGSVAAGIYDRARVARAAFLALDRSEAVYFLATTDDQGRPLTGGADYRLEGRDLPARWWSVTVYGADHFLIPNAANRYSYTKSNVARGPDGGFVIRLSRDEKPGNWLPTGAGGFVVVLRLYNPPEEVTGNMGNIELPAIVREDDS